MDIIKEFDHTNLKQILKIINSLNEMIKDAEKVENKQYGYKTAAVRARKVCQKAINDLKDIKKEIQVLKNTEE